MTYRENNIKWIPIMLAILCGIISIRINTAECYWDFPLEKAVSYQYWEEYPVIDESFYLYDKQKAANIVEINRLKEISHRCHYPLVHAEATRLHKTIMYDIKQSSPMSFNEMLSCIDTHCTIFLKEYPFKPLNYAQCQDPDHPFNGMLTVMAVAARNNLFSDVSNTIRVTGAYLLMHTMSCYPDMNVPLNLELAETFFMDRYSVKMLNL